MSVVVKGESTILWEVILKSEDGDAYDHELVRTQALDFVSDMLQLESFGDVEARIISEDDRTITVRGRHDQAQVAAPPNVEVLGAANGRLRPVLRLVADRQGGAPEGGEV